MSTAWGIGLIIGPALGGFLAQVFFLSPKKGSIFLLFPVGEVLSNVPEYCALQPAEKYPYIFSKDSVFGK